MHYKYKEGGYIHEEGEEPWHMPGYLVITRDPDQFDGVDEPWHVYDHEVLPLYHLLGEVLMSRNTPAPQVSQPERFPLESCEICNGTTIDYLGRPCRRHGTKR